MSVRIRRSKALIKQWMIAPFSSSSLRVCNSLWRVAPNRALPDRARRASKSTGVVAISRGECGSRVIERVGEEVEKG